MVRQTGAVFAGAATAALGALILGEYAFAGATPYLAGVFFGLVVAEIILTVAGGSTLPLAAAAGVESGLGLAWAVWISIGGQSPHHEPIPGAAFVSVALGVLVGAVWVALPPRRGARAPVPAAAVDDAPPDPTNEP